LSEPAYAINPLENLPTAKSDTNTIKKEGKGKSRYHLSSRHAFPRDYLYRQGKYGIEI
jgi:hypothetical protein